ncbi:hypothetical protein [Photobacterium leiognathi]|uniref:hypothetical protein n=1 Tax=Photobacterium leiognathi TaxID=553611 RepID=UPI002980ECBD|nr:hypothetical protein [Photobacterium leiognathi]
MTIQEIIHIHSCVTYLSQPLPHGLNSKEIVDFIDQHYLDIVEDVHANQIHAFIEQDRRSLERFFSNKLALAAAIDKQQNEVPFPLFKLTLIEASGTYLTQFFTEQVINDRQEINFIEKHKAEFCQYLNAELLFDQIKQCQKRLFETCLTHKTTILKHLQQQPFNIPAIYNEREALLSYLGLADDENNEAYTELLAVDESTHHFKVKNTEYLVSRHLHGQPSCVYYFFNGSNWSISTNPASDHPLLPKKTRT